MAISFVAAGAVSTGANATVAVPAGIAAGDLLVIVSAGSAASSIGTVYPGWTRIANQAAGQFISVHTKIAGSFETSVVLTQTGTTSKAVMLAYRGVGWYDVVASFNTGISTSAATLTQTTGFTNDYVVSIYADNAAAATWTAPASTTSRVNSASTASFRGLLVVDELKATAGATTARTATLSSSTTWAAVSISIREPQTCYWVGAAGTWSGTTKTNWATSSGGTAGTIVPGNDPVVFDVNSNTGTTAWTVTLSTTDWARCASFVTSSLDATMTLALGTTNTYGLECYGDFTCPTAATMSFTGVGGTIFMRPFTTATLTTNGKTISGNVGITDGTVTLGSALSATGGFSVTAATFSTSASSYNITTSGTTTLGGGPVAATVSLNGSSLTLNSSASFTAGSPATLTLNAGTSTIYGLGGGTSFNGGGQTYYDVNISTGSASISGANTYRSLTFTYGVVSTRSAVVFPNQDTQTCTYTFVITGGSFANRITVASSTNGAPDTSVITTTISAPTTLLSYADFYGIVGTGGGSWAGASLGDIGLNTGISFTAPKTVYWTNTGGASVLTTASYSLTSGGGGTTTAFPLPQDTVIFDNTGLNAGSTVSFPRNNQWYPKFDASGLTNAVTFQITGTGTTDSYFTGGLILSDSVTFGLNTYGLLFGGDFTLGASSPITGTSDLISFIPTRSSTLTVTSNGNPNFFNKFTAKPMSVVGYGTGQLVVFADSITTTADLSLTNCTLDISAGDLTAESFASTGTTTRSIVFGTSTLLTTQVGNIVFNVVGTNFTYTGSGNVAITGGGATATTVTASSGFTESNALNFEIVDGTYVLTATGIVTKNFIFSNFTGSFSSTNPITVYGDYALFPGMTNSGNQAINFYATSGTYTVATNGVTLDRPINFAASSSSTAVWNLGSAMAVGTFGTARTATLNGGRLNLNGYSLSAFIFTMTNSPTLDFSTGSITAIGNATTIFTQPTTATILGTPLVYLTYIGSSGTRTINAVATEANAIRFTILGNSSGSDIVAFTSGNSIKNLTFSTSYNVWANATLTIYGSLTLSSTMIVSSGTGTRTFAGTSGTKTITSNGKTLDFPINFNGVGSTWQLQDAMTTGTGRTFTFTNGTLDLNSKTLTCGTFNANVGGVKTLAFGASGNISVAGSTVGSGFQLVSGTYTVTGTNPLVYMNTGTSGVTKQFGCGSRLVSFVITGGTDALNIITNFECNNIDFSGFAGPITISNAGGLFPYGSLTLGASNTWPVSPTFYFGFYATSGSYTITTAGLTLDLGFYFDTGATYSFTDALTQAAGKTFTFAKGTLKLKDGVTSTVGTLSIVNATYKALLSTTPGVQATISQASGTVNAIYTNIQDSNATGGASWNALPANGNTDLGNNTGWYFGVVALTADITETMSASEAQDALYAAFASITESTTATDSQSYSWNTSSFITETTTAADSSTTSWVTNSTTGETFALSDAANAGFVLSASFAESLSISEVQAYVNIFTSAITENVTLSEAITKQAILFVSQTESATATSLEGVQAVFTGQISETVTASDLEAATAKLNAAITEQVEASDTPLASVRFTVNIVEPSTISEAQNRTATLIASRTESVTASHTNSAVSAYNVICDETTEMSVIQYANFNINVDTEELVTITDYPYAAMYQLLEILAAQQHVLSADAYVYNVSAAVEPGNVTPIVEDSEIQVSVEVIYPTIH